MSTIIFGVLGTLEQSGLANVRKEATDAVMKPKVIFVSLLAAVIWLLWWLTVDVNLTSVHGLYRDRLAAAFLIGKNTKGDIGIEEDIDLDEICRYEARSTAPYHLINVALNLQGSKNPGIRDRKNDFFIFSKRFTGGLRTGYRHRNPTFPHQSTADQFFGEDQFEAYRALGQHIAEDALQAWKPANPATTMSFDDFRDWFIHPGEETRRKLNANDRIKAGIWSAMSMTSPSEAPLTPKLPRGGVLGSY